MNSAWRGAVGATLLWLGAAGRCLPAAPPSVHVAPQETRTGFFGGEEVRLRFLLKSDEPGQGRLVWTYSAAQRTLARGEQVVALEPARPPIVEIPLRLPDVREGVVYETRLRVQVVGEPGGQIVSPESVRVLRLFAPDPFSLRRTWLGGLNLVLFDPVGDTRRTLETARISFKEVSDLDALALQERGLVVVGEGVSLREHPGLPETVFRLAERGMRVLWLAPGEGRFPFPAAEGPGHSLPSSLRLCGVEVIREMDARLDADGWPVGGGSASVGLLPSSGQDRVFLAVGSPAEGWPWLEVEYAGGGRLILCGLGIVRNWSATPAPRYIVMRILERLDPTRGSIVASKEEE